MSTGKRNKFNELAAMRPPHNAGIAPDSVFIGKAPAIPVIVSTTLRQSLGTGSSERPGNP